MNDQDAKVFAVLDKPRTNKEIESRTGMKRGVVMRTLRRLSAQGKIVSVGTTRSRRHMRLVTAIERLLIMVEDLQRN